MDKAEICKRRMLTIFNQEWKASRNKERAYDRALDALGRCIKRHSIINKGQVTGLEGELLYYYLEFENQKLSAESASGLHSDFRGVVGGRPAAIDVTTRPDYKDSDKFKEVREAFGGPWDYYIGTVDLGSRDTNTYPLLLPRCHDGSPGHLVLILFETDLESLGGRFGMISDTQMLVRYNPSAEDDDAALENLVREWGDIVTHPGRYHDDLMSEVGDDKIYSTEKEAMGDFTEYARSLAYQFRQESGFVLSAVATSEEIFHGPKREHDWVTRLFWVHPHSYVRRVLGKPLQDLEHNIAGVAYDKL